MGLADRHYVRGSPRTPGDFGRVGGVHLISVNTWLIIINIAVFVLANGIFARTLLQISYGTTYRSGVTDAEIQRGVVDDSVAYQLPDMPGVFYHPVIDPAARGPFGIPIDPRTGRRADIIGQERFTRQPIFHALGHFSTGKAFTELQIWRFITFQFLHANLAHLLFNMVGLWFVGEMVERRLGRRRYLAFYLLCGAAGAVMYLILNLLGYAIGARLPGLLTNDLYTPLVGASAGVFGVLMAAARLYPNEIVLVMMLVPMRLATAVYLFIFLAALNLFFGGTNAGGDAAHLGGAIAGALLIRRPYLLSEVVDFFTPKSRRRPRGPRGPAPPTEAEVDRILDKIAVYGRASLTPEELDVLRRAARGLERS
jgi:membrane associated rhomboid family serine protease